MNGVMESVLELVRSFQNGYVWLLATGAIAYLYATYRYHRLLHETGDQIRLGAISVKGGISQELGANAAALLLRTRFSAVTESFRKGTGARASLYAAEAVAAQFPTIETALLEVAPELKPPQLQVKEDIVSKVGTVEIPVGAIVNLFLALLRWLPVPYRRRYEASLIHLSLISIGPETQLLVSRESQHRTSFGRSVVEEKGQPVNQPMVLARTAAVGNLTDLTNLLRDAVFMILQLDGKAFPGRNWLGMRCFADGLVALNEYRRTAKEEFLEKARESFGRAADVDAGNYKALYFYSLLLLFERTRESIATATKVFTRALRTEDPMVKALVHTGLANCYAQQFHRLAERGPDVLKKAREQAELAHQEWERAQEQMLKSYLAGGKELPGRNHPWILATRALVQTVDEGTTGTREEAKKRFLAAARFYTEAIETERHNGMFWNNLGWLLLKLTEWRVQDLKDLVSGEKIPPGLSGNAAELSERYLRRSLELNPKNKLSHANLCLLYASPWYRKRQEKEEREKYLHRCRYYGLAAIQLDPNYINGHRDLSLSLLRYEQFDEAYRYFKEALRLATAVEKDEEIIHDALAVLDEMKEDKIQITEQERKRWQYPDPSLLVPPDAGSARPRPAKAEHQAPVL
ncbi:hypothetical protein MYX77_00965 [Acidobacteriia bacterium AH_259_A11_L15]|nr:hypothetical protein [Acidobacteriia bacterium AH_259_A11_L15]